MKNKQRITFLFSDTGGGHRSAAEAVVQALEAIAGDTIQIKLVDFLKDHAPVPFNQLPKMYPAMVKRPAGWGIGYKLSNRPRRARAIGAFVWPYVAKAAQHFIGKPPPDLLVSFHPLANDVVGRELARRGEKERPPFVVVVTDLVSTHAFWHTGDRDLTIVPTESAKTHAIECGLSPESVRVIGLPVAEKFSKPGGSKNELRAELGWELGRRIVLLVGGGEGMGPLEQTTRAIAESGLDVGVAVVTGRNQFLFEKLNAAEWPVPVYVYGFVRNMPELMQAADVLVTKAGPGTISEGLNAGLPVILYSYLPGQEAGNIPYLTDQGAGIWAPTPDEVAAGLKDWLENPDVYENAVRASKKLARPDAAKEIAHLLLEQLRE